MAVYAAPLVLPTSDDPVIAIIEGEKKDQSKTKEQKELEEEVLFIQQIYEGASAAACSLYTDSHPLFTFPGRRYHTTPPNFC